MTYQEAIEAIKANFPTSNRTMLCDALNLAIKVLEEKVWDNKTVEWELDRE